MARHGPISALQDAIVESPLQGTKFVVILLSLVFGAAGFFRLVDAAQVLEGPLFGDTQFLALILLPLIGIVLAVVVFVETLVTGYRVVRSNDSLGEQIEGRPGYVLLRGIEAAVAVVGVAIIVTAIPPLVAESTPAPAGVGIMLLLMAIGVAILIASLVRSGAELFVYREAAASE